MAEKGIDDATMAEISERADVALGSLYNHFANKDALAVAVVDVEIERIAEGIVTQTADFADPAMVFAFGCRTVMEHATTDERWRRLLASPEVITDSFRRGFGPYACADMQRAVDAGRFHCPDVELAWRLTTWAIIGASSAVCSGEISSDSLTNALIAILGIVGVDVAAASRLVDALPLPQEVH